MSNLEIVLQDLNEFSSDVITELDVNFAKSTDTTGTNKILEEARRDVIKTVNETVDNMKTAYAQMIVEQPANAPLIKEQMKKMISDMYAAQANALAATYQ